ncbi:hypothetical protein [Streptomyces sp. NBC_00503]|uniref:hypothetical protein n=1 Tax=Streptomyces sp. NBC_00503 TaxID=2903659 RepID=UPI002E819476|nr:hypothetical protein [Streptomyces sp. NBC_00503]WUD85686.1 transposase [Streptomyces sp. NBC_00503]
MTVLRHRTDLRSANVTRQTVYALTDLTARQASPQRLGQLARSQWVIENWLHFVRDSAFAEDASKIRTGRGPQNMATFRSFAINHPEDGGSPTSPPVSTSPSAVRWTSSVWPDRQTQDHQAVEQPWARR